MCNRSLNWGDLPPSPLRDIGGKANSAGCKFHYLNFIWGIKSFISLYHILEKNKSALRIIGGFHAHHPSP